MKRGADWLSWSLQLIAGFVVGAIFGLSVQGRSSSHDLLACLGFTLGAALIGAGLASFYGDWLWIASSYRVIPPDDVEHSGVSRGVSVVTCTTGAVLVLLTVLRLFHFLPR
jgi:hypothetical protein